MKRLLAAAAISGILFGSCAKEGLDGSATLLVRPEHHGAPIVSTAAYPDSVYIKFDVDEIPADPTHDYDAVITGSVGQSVIHVHNVKWGKYSIYCAGYDSAISERVTGGVLLKIKRSERTAEIEVFVPVVED